MDLSNGHMYAQSFCEDLMVLILQQNGIQYLQVREPNYSSFCTNEIHSAVNYATFRFKDEITEAIDHVRQQVPHSRGAERPWALYSSIALTAARIFQQHHEDQYKSAFIFLSFATSLCVYYASREEHFLVAYSLKAMVLVLMCLLEGGFFYSLSGLQAYAVANANQPPLVADNGHLFYPLLPF